MDTIAKSRPERLKEIEEDNSLVLYFNRLTKSNFSEIILNVAYFRD